MAKATDYAIDAGLTNFAVTYRPTGYIGLEAVTTVPVTKENFQYHKFQKDEFWRIPETLRAESAEAREIDLYKSKVSASVQEHSLRVPIPWRTLDNADPVTRVELTKTRLVEDLLQLRLEKKVVALYADSTVPSVTLAGNDRWFVSGVEGTTSDPEDDIKTGKEAIRKESGGWYPNSLIIPAHIATNLARHSKIRDQMKYTINTLAAGRDLPPSLWDMRVLIPQAVENTGAVGASYTGANLWGDNVYLAYINPTPDPDGMTAFACFWHHKEVRKWDVDARKVRLIESSHLYIEALIDAKLAYAIKVAVA